MTPAEFKAVGRRLGYSAAQTAVAVGVNSRTVRRWEAGPDDVPGPAAFALSRHERLVEVGLEDRVPAPRRGRPRLAS